MLYRFDTDGQYAFEGHFADTVRFTGPWRLEAGDVLVKTAFVLVPAQCRYEAQRMARLKDRYVPDEYCFRTYEDTTRADVTGTTLTLTPLESGTPNQYSKCGQDALAWRPQGRPPYIEIDAPGFTYHRSLENEN